MTAAILLLTFLLLLLAVAGIAIWNALAWPSLTTDRSESPASVSILIPARDEAGNIDACLASALAQGPSVREVLVFDDRSTDGTATMVNAVAARDPRVRLIEGRDLPEGWCGKNHACARLADAAQGEWLLFVDADARLASGLLPRLLADAARRKVTLLSPWPALAAVTFWERVLMPMLEVLTFSIYPAPLSLLRNDPSLGVVHGACILARRDVYDAIGGHAAIRGEILEDQRLAHLWRERGGRSLCVLGRDAVQVRMYQSLREIWFGFGKNFYPAFRSGWSFWAFLLLHALIFLAPMLYVLIAPGYAAFAALALLVVIRVALGIRFHHSPWSLALHPVADAILVAIGVASWWRCRSGRGVEWKGRRYQVTHAAARTGR